MAYSKIMPEFSRLKDLQSTDLDPIDNLWDVLEKAVLSGLILPSLKQNLGVKLLDVNKQQNIQMWLFFLARQFFWWKTLMSCVTLSTTFLHIVIGHIRFCGVRIDNSDLFIFISQSVHPCVQIHLKRFLYSSQTIRSYHLLVLRITRWNRSQGKTQKLNRFSSCSSCYFLKCFRPKQTWYH